MIKQQDELRDKLRALPRTSHLDPRYPIDAYEDDLIELIDSEMKDRISKYRFGGFSDDGLDEYINELNYEKQRRDNLTQEKNK